MTVRKIWHDDAWKEYIEWQTQDKKTLKKINNLLKDIDRNGYNSIGKPEPLRGNLTGFYSVASPAFAKRARSKRLWAPVLIYTFAT